MNPLCGLLFASFREKIMAHKHAKRKSAKSVSVFFENQDKSNSALSPILRLWVLPLRVESLPMSE